MVGAIACGILVSLATGLLRNEPGISIPEIKNYGYPLAWRVTSLNGPTQFISTNLALDAVFWIAVSFFAWIILEKIALPKWRVGFKYETFLLLLILFIPLGLVMDFVHEFGHALWGIAVGGRLTYMKVAYLEIYPRLALTPEFILGEVVVAGLSFHSFEYGLFLLGGSLTTNIASWLLALTLLRTRFGFKTRVALRILGLFGLVDLPFYVLFPQMGLRHWIFLGGCQPEPLIGARKMGVPDPAFYTVVVLTTFGLVFLHFKPLLKKVWKRMRMLLGTI